MPVAKCRGVRNTQHQKGASPMLTTKFFPTLMIALQIAAAVVYAWHNPGDWRHIGYWLSAAALTVTVTY